MNKKRNFFYYLSVYMQLGLVIVITILIFLLIGRYIDKKLGTKAFSLVFIILGVVAAGYNAYKMMRMKDGG